MFTKKTRHKIQFSARVETIEQIPSAYVKLGGGVKLAYAKGKQPSHRGETNVVQCSSQTISLNETLKWTTKILRDDKTGTFESKVIVFKLKHVSADGHKEKTLGTADVDLATLSATPKSQTRLAIQFAARSQGKLKTKAILVISHQWVKVGDKTYRHQDEAAAHQATNPTPEQQDAAPNNLMTTPFFGEDETASEISSTSSGDVEDLDDSTVIIESTDLDTNDMLIKTSNTAQGNGSVSRIVNPHLEHSRSSTAVSSQSTGTQSMLTIPETSPAPESASPRASVTVSSEAGSSVSVQANGVSASTSQNSSPSQSSNHASSTRSSTVQTTPITQTMHMRVVKQKSHPEMPSQGKPGAAQSTSPEADPHLYSSSMGVLPEFHVEPSHRNNVTGLSASHSTGRSRGKSMHGHPGGPISTRPSHVNTIAFSTPVGSSQASATNLLQHAASAHSASGSPSATHDMSGTSYAGHTNPQASVLQPAEPSPYLSYVDNDAPELPDSSQATLLYIAPNSFAIQNAAIAGDEVARLRAEKMDKNVKLALLGKQVSALEQSLSEMTAKWEEAERRDTAKTTEIASLERKVKRLRKKTKLLDSTLDESSTTSSGNDPSKPSSGNGSEEKKRRKRKNKDANSSNNGSSSSLVPRSPAPRYFWTPEEERLGLLIILAIGILVIIFFCSPQFRCFATTALEYTGLLSPASSLPSSEVLLSEQVNSAANELSEAFASALNLSNTST